MDMVKKLASGVVCAVLGVLSTQAARLPAGYEELEYIESTGTQYVDTGVNITPTMAVEADAQVTVIEKQGRIFGNAYEASDSNGQGYMSFALYMNGANQSQWATAMQDNGGDWVSSGVSADTSRHTHKLDCTGNRKYKLDGTDKGNAHPTVTKSTKWSLYLFANHGENNVATGISKMRLYSCKIYNSGNVAHDYVPARRHSDCALGLYDTKTDVFHPNAGTGKFCPGPAVLDPLAWPDGKPKTNAFEKTMEISIGENMVSGVLTNFQALVRLSESKPHFHYADCGEKGADIRFTLPDGTLLAHEVDTWDTNGESLIWVNITNLTAATKFRMYWKPRSGATLPEVDPRLTWPGYAGVWHFGDAYPTNAPDSSANGYDAICASDGTTQIDGKVGKTFHNSTAGAVFGTGITASILGGIKNVQSFTISGWMKADSAACGYARFAYKGGYQTPGWGINMQNKDTQITFRSHNTQSLFSPNCSSITSWQHFTCIYTYGGVGRLIENGVLKSSASNKIYAGESPGIELDLYAALVGSGDELRIRNGVTSEAHALADYKTQTDAGFLSYGKVETQRAPGTAIHLI